MKGADRGADAIRGPRVVAPCSQGAGGVDLW
jgi:hypothetical protein